MPREIPEERGDGMPVTDRSHNEPPAPTPVELAIYMCSAQERCVCGKTPGHAGWLLCVERYAREHVDA